MISAGLPASGDDREWRLLWRTVIAAGIEQGRAALMSATFDRQAALYQTVLDVGAVTGEFELQQPSWDIARTLMTMEDYIGFRIVAQDPPSIEPPVWRSCCDMASSPRAWHCRALSDS